jgi:uncharacterized membrane protein
VLLRPNDAKILGTLKGCQSAAEGIRDDGHGTLSLVGRNDSDIPRYAILSHTWGADTEEVIFNDLKKGTGKNKAGYNKIEFCRKQATSDGLSTP